jgi:predicted nucleotidyltransferase
MNAQDPNVASVELVAHALRELCEELVLVGGCAVGLLITDPARPSGRATQDVDLIAEVTSLGNYYNLQQKLKDRGFQEQGDVICRWRKGALIVDVMPAEEIGLGFSNRWYPLAVQYAQHLTLPSRTVIRIVNAPLFIATKLESFQGRGEGDYGHHDIEDIVNLVDGRKELLDEVASSDQAVREYIQQEIEDLLADELFTEQLPWHLHPDPSNQARATLLIERLRKLAGL